MGRTRRSWIGTACRHTLEDLNSMTSSSRMSDAGAQGPDTASPCEEPGSAGSVADHIQFRIVYGRNSKLVSRSPQHTVRELKREIEEHTGELPMVGGQSCHS